MRRRGRLRPRRWWPRNPWPVPVSIDPGEEALDHPAPWQHLKTGLVSNLPDDLDDDDGGGPDAVCVIGAVSEGELDEGKGIAGGLEQRNCAVAVLDVGRMGQKDERAPVGVDHGVALATLDLLAGVITPGAARFDCFDALAVDHHR